MYIGYVVDFTSRPVYLTSANIRIATALQYHNHIAISNPFHFDRLVFWILFELKFQLYRPAHFIIMMIFHYYLNSQAAGMLFVGAAVVTAMMIATR